MLTVQADSSCQLTATAGGTTDAAVDPAADSSNKIEWLKWTGAAVLFVEGLLVRSNIFRSFGFECSMNLVCCSQQGMLAGQYGSGLLECHLALQCGQTGCEQAASCHLCFASSHLLLLVWQGLLIPFFFKLRWSFFGGWFLAALNCFAGGVFLTFGASLRRLLCSNLLALRCSN